MIKPETPQRLTFHRFFDCWLAELNANLQQLVSAADHHHAANSIQDHSILLHLIDKAVNHYEQYFKVKSDEAKGDVISMFSPTWLTTLEDTFLWIAGWRPTTAIQLLYSKLGIQLEARFSDLVPVLNDVGDLGDLTSNQINQVDQLQAKTIREERSISEKMATLQESVADASMVDASNVVSAMIRNQNGGGRESDGRLESALELKNNGLREVLDMADSLRLETLKSVLGILTPIQSVHFLIAAAELHLRLHDWGKKRDNRDSQQNRPSN